jgi:hypothetical protein
MTSEQVMLTFVVLALGACAGPAVHPVEPLKSPYEQRRVWAVAPLRNESGSLYADGVKMADRLAHQLENAANLDVLPVNRCLRAMDAMGIGQIATQQDAMRMVQTLGVDGLIVGTISAYDPYDPPRIGLALELYLSPRYDREQADLDVRRLSRAATDELALAPPANSRQPVVVVSDILDARSPGTRENLQRYALDRGVVKSKDAWVNYRINIDLYSEFVSYVMSWRLLRAEAQRIAPLAQVEPVP